MRSGTGLLRAVIGVLAMLLGLGVYKLYDRGRALEGDLVITGRTLPTSESTNPIRPVVDAPKPSMQSPSSAMPSASKDQDKPTEVVVHVAGAVRRPGIYHLSPDSRADDALKAAGGAKPDANLDAINLAAHVEDGKQLYVPTRVEQPQGGAPEQTAQAQPASANHHVNATGLSHSHSQKLTSPNQGTININTASAEELQRLPGVGPSYAVRIVQFRKENGPFANPDQLMDVSGIGDKKFAKMRPFVRVK